MSLLRAHRARSEVYLAKFRLPTIPYIKLRLLIMMPSRYRCGNGFRTLGRPRQIPQIPVAT
jgi:hypothetical protein